MALGHEGDHMNNLVTILWAYGGRLNDEQGVPDITNPANKKGIEIVVEMWKAKLIPPDTFAQTVTSWNNETYQKGRGLIAINPATIMGWLLVNDKELADKTGLSPPPKGSAGLVRRGRRDRLLDYFKKAQAGRQGAVRARVLHAAGQPARRSPSRSRGASSRSTSTTPRATSGRRAFAG